MSITLGYDSFDYQEQETELAEAKEKRQDRRNNRFRFDKSVTLGSILSVCTMLYALYTGVESIKNEFRITNQRVTIMWEHFKREHNDITPYEKSLGDAGVTKSDGL